MPVQTLRDFLDRNRIKYVVISHSPAHTAQEVAASAHIPGRAMAKTVIVRLDGRLAMAVLPASEMIDLDLLGDAAFAQQAELADESEFRDRFPGCDLGAMPPFGNLYSMPVYVAERLTEDEEIAFNAGSSTEVILMMYQDYDRLVQPRVLPVGVPA